MSKSSRKGASGEREVCALLRDELGIDATRQLDQARDGGADILIDIAGKRAAIEVKRAERSQPLQWLRQVQAVRDVDLHIVMWRPSRENWIGILPWPTLATLLRECGVDAPGADRAPAPEPDPAPKARVEQIAAIGAGEALALLSDGTLWRLDRAANWAPIPGPQPASAAQTSGDDPSSRVRA